MTTLFIILIFIILLNCLKKNNNLEGLENKNEVEELQKKYDSICSSNIKDDDDCVIYCNKDNYVINKDEIDIDENTKCLKNKSIIDKVNGVFDKIKNCDLCVYCKLLKNKLDIEIEKEKEKKREREKEKEKAKRKRKRKKN